MLFHFWRILTFIFIFSLFFLLGFIVIFPIKIMLHYRKLIKYLKSNNLKDDLIFLKIIDQNNQPLPRCIRPKLALQYLKRETNDNELRIIKNRYTRMLKRHLISIAIIISIILVDILVYDIFFNPIPGSW